VVSEGTITFQAGVPRTHARLGWMLAPLAVGLGTLVVAAVALWPFRSLSTDEAVAVDRARQPFGDLLHTIAHHEPAQAGYLLTLKAATLAGTDERTLRAASALALALAAALMVVLATLLLGRVEGLVAGVALGANAGAVAVSVEVAPYALGLLGVVVATLLFVAAVERRSPWLWALYAVACLVLPLIHPLAASVLLAHAAALVVRPGRRDPGAAILIAAAGLAGLGRRLRDGLGVLVDGPAFAVVGLAPSDAIGGAADASAEAFALAFALRGLRGLGFLRIEFAADELDPGHVGRVAAPEAGLDDPDVSARTPREAGGQGVEELLEDVLVGDVGAGHPPGMEGRRPALGDAALRDRDQLLRERAQFLRAGHGGLEVFVLEQRGCEVPQHRQAMLGDATQLAMGDSVAHIF